jgi:cytochrome P450
VQHAQAIESLTREFDGLVACRPDLIQNPYPLYRRLRDEAPVYRHAHQVVVTRFDDVSAVLTNATTFLSGHAGLRGSRVRAAIEAASPERQQKLIEVLEFRGGGLNHLNGDQHARLRALSHRAFTPRVIQRLENGVRAIADELLDPLQLRSGQFELIDEFAFQLPLFVICDMLDVPREDSHVIRAWSNDIAAFQDGTNAAALDAAHASMFALRDHLRAIFARRRGTHTTDVMGALLAAEGDDGDHFREDELIPVIAHFVFAGHETTTNLIGNGVRALLVDAPDQWRLLLDQRNLVPAAVDELLRYDNPVQLTNRTAATDTELAATPIRQWDTLALIIGAANRDPTKFANPDRVDVTRAHNRHLGFGLGPHFCLGAALTRLETTIALHALLDRFPHLTVTDPDTVRYRPDHRLRGLQALPLTPAGYT